MVHKRNMDMLLLNQASSTQVMYEQAAYQNGFTTRSAVSVMPANG